MDLRTDILPYRDRLYRLALSITLHTAEAEDAVQDTILRAWEHREEWPQIQNVEAWLMQICRNLALDRKKKLDRTVPFSTTVTPDSTSPSSARGEETTLPNSLITPPKAEEMGETALLAQLINQLPTPQNDIVRLRDIEGFTYNEIALRLNLTDTQVRVYLHRARQKLREQYTRLNNFGL